MKESAITIGIYDEKELFGNLIYFVFDRMDGIQPCLRSSSEYELFANLKIFCPQIFLISLLKAKGYHCAFIKKIKQEYPLLKIIAYVFGIGLTQESTSKIICSGASAILTDSHSLGEMDNAIRDVMEKDFHRNDIVSDTLYSYYRSNMASRPSFGQAPTFNEREIQLVELRRSGLTAEQIAEKMCLGKKSIDMGFCNLYRKFDCHNFHELIVQFDAEMI
ncbi:MAG: LuxR C-terminal-related transcriptional regulator [Bacteroidetes bacterium]|nr:LuxR C-terminal-related transcriptional regulator [Bacteroidota bacterium]